MKTDKWLVKNSRTIYKDPWIRVRLDSVKRPNGFSSNYSVVELKGGIGVVVLDKDNKFYIVGQYRYAADCYSWEIPKGAFESFTDKISPLETAKRELKEETGIVARKWKQLAMVHTLLGSTNDKVFLFLATDLRIGKSHREEGEMIQMQKVSFSKFNRMVDQQIITDATSMAAVAIVQRFRAL